ncbi:Kelch-like protein 30 [Tetrabaena socialis]|uniref:Kelch-like protein 30 n=1 Tax=Tetrabaena socialis TaxID=47790 RepID=A0A2J7ZVD1_9CHLO|nr:Kelch-like protein 30 [Tetrabaena socialis]|eukprot:PNH04241.1 Kelch-like protein 30 [Tetrabaena socialis]
MDPPYRLVPFAAPNVRAVCSRPGSSINEPEQPLVFCDFGVCPLLGLDSEGCAGLRLGPPLHLSGPGAALMDAACDAIYDHYIGATVVAVDAGWWPWMPTTAAPGSAEVHTLRDGSRRHASVFTLGYVTSSLLSENRWLYSTAVGWLQSTATKRNVVLRCLSSLLGWWRDYTLPYGLLYALPYTASGEALVVSRDAADAGATTASDVVRHTAAAARFWGVCDTVLDTRGCTVTLSGSRLYMRRATGERSSYRLSAGDGTSGRSNSGLGHRLIALPNGSLIAYGIAEHEVTLLLPDDGIDSNSSSACPPLPSLSDDLATLLAQPAATADVTVLVGGRRFPLHQSILAARCPYFASLLSSGFADSAAPELVLPDADPDTFAAITHHIYTGATTYLQAPLLRSVAVLADRLLLLAFCRLVQRQLLQGVTPASAPGELLWAEQAGMAWLQGRLEAYFLRHRAAVARQGQEGVRELRAGASAGLLARLQLSGL